MSGGDRPILDEERVVYDAGFLSVISRSFRFSESIVTRTVVRHPGAVVILPVALDRTVVFVRQFRAAIGAEILELPAGKRDVIDEPAATTALRELQEECGLGATSLIAFGSFLNSPGFSDERTEVFGAFGLYMGARSPQSVEESYATVVPVAFAAIAGLIESGVLQDAKSIIGYAFLERFFADASRCKAIETLTDDSEVTAWLADGRV
ncbi:MAG: NUDIX hydrolase [Ferrimicrobium sp.]